MATPQRSRVKQFTIQSKRKIIHKEYHLGKPSFSVSRFPRYQAPHVLPGQVRVKRGLSCFLCFAEYRQNPIKERVPYIRSPQAVNDPMLSIGYTLTILANDGLVQVPRA